MDGYGWCKVNTVLRGRAFGLKKIGCRVGNRHQPPGLLLCGTQ